MSASTMPVRLALVEIIGAISDAPSGSDEMMGRAFCVLAGPISKVAMAVATGEDLMEAHAGLAAARAEVKGMGR